MSTGSYNVHDSHRSAEAEIQRLAAQARLGWEKEARNLTWFGLKDGMSLLEVGSGPGFVTESLLTFLPNSALTCLELDPMLIQQAKQYLEKKGTERVQFFEGSVMDTKFAEN